MKNYPVVRTDKMCGTDDRIYLYSLKYMGTNGSTPTEITNGSVVKLGDLVSTADPEYTSREVYVAGNVAANTPIEDVVLVATPEVCYDERDKNLDDFTNPAGAIARGYGLHKGCIFSLTAEAFDGTPKKGNVVELAAGTKFKTVTSATSGSTKIGKIEAVEKVGKYTYYVVRVTG